MLKIQVLGNGLIPRGLGLAPRKEPFSADLTLIRTIMSTPGLKVNMIRPDDSRVITLTNQNMMRMWQMYNDAHLKENKIAVPQLAPSTPISPSGSVHSGMNFHQENSRNITPDKIGSGNVVDPADKKPVTQDDVKTTTPEKPETPVENKTDVDVSKPADATQEKVEEKKPETNNNNQNNNNNKPGYTVKPINADDRKNNGK